MRYLQILSGMLILAAAAACTEKTQPVSAAVSRPAAAVAPASPSAPVTVVPPQQQLEDTLMSAVFGAHYDLKKREAVGELEDASTQRKASYLVAPVQHKVLASGDVVLLARARLPGSDESENNGQTGWLSVYFLRQEEGAWLVAGRRDDAMYLDRAANLSATWISPGKGKEGLAVVASREWETGCVDAALMLLELTPTSVRRLSEEIPTRSSATVDECNRAYSDSRWSVQSKWRFATPRLQGPFDDLVLTFTGELASPPVDENGQPTGARVAAKVSGTARYAYDAKLEKYVLAEGTNAIPSDPEDYDG